VPSGASTYYVWVSPAGSIVLDCKPDDAALLQRLLRRADVVIQNLGPGAAERGGFGSAKLRAERPELITCDITGYGETGPMKDMRAYDLMVQAESGVAYVTGSPQEPGRVGVSACDVATGMYAHAAILEALVRRGKTGEGASIHFSLFESMADWMTVPLLTYEHAGRDWPRTGLGHPLIVPYGAYNTRDGAILVSVQNHREWQRFCEAVLENAALVDDARFATNQDRTRNKDELNAIINSVMSALSQEEAIARLTRADLAFARVNDVAALSRHSQLRRASVQTPVGPVDVVAPPATFRVRRELWAPCRAWSAHRSRSQRVRELTDLEGRRHEIRELIEAASSRCRRHQALRWSYRSRWRDVRRHAAGNRRADRSERRREDNAVFTHFGLSGGRRGECCL
jgi:crotonobetainyl-CoA:carnitine CoA-transferase CaiB-like acyl-CoA transferase